MFICVYMVRTERGVMKTDRLIGTSKTSAKPEFRSEPFSDPAEISALRTGTRMDRTVLTLGDMLKLNRMAGAGKTGRLVKNG